MYFLIKIIHFTLKNLFIQPKNCVQSILYNERCKNFRKNIFFSNTITFLSVIRQNFEYNLRVLANFWNFHVKLQNLWISPIRFQKTTFFFVFFNKSYTFYIKNLFIRPKNCVQSIFYNERCKQYRKNHFFGNIFTFLSVIRQNFEDNLRILANFGKFSRKNSKIYGFRPYVLKKLQGFFLYFLIKIILFTLKIYSYSPKIVFKAFFTTKDAKSFVKINFLVTFFTFLSVTRQNFEDTLRILANFGKFSRKNSKFYGFRPYVFKKLVFFFLIKIIVFTLKIFSFGPKIAFKAFFYYERCKKFRKNQFFSNIFTFLSVIRQNFEYNLRILGNIEKFSRKNLKIYGFRQYV